MSQLGVNLGLNLGSIDALIQKPRKLTLICLSPCQLRFFEAKLRIAVSMNISALYELHLSCADFYLSCPSLVHLVTHLCCCQSQVRPSTRYCTWIRIPVGGFCILTTLCFQEHKSRIYTKMQLLSWHPWGVTDRGEGLPQKQIQPGLTACKRLTDAVSCPNQKNYGMHAGICFISSMHWGMCTGEVVLKSTAWEVSTQWVYVEIKLWRLPPTGDPWWAT